MNRTAPLLVAALLACGGSHVASNALSLSITGAPVTSGSDGSTVLEVTAGQELTVVLVAVGPGADAATFASPDLPGFATLSGARLTLAPAQSDIGPHLFEIIASTPEASTALRLLVSVASACGVDGCRARWASVFGTADDDLVWYVAAGAGGQVWAAGTMGTDVFLRGYAPDGSVLLDERWPSDSGTVLLGLAVRPEGGVAMTLAPRCLKTPPCFAPDFGAGGGEGYVLAAFDASGTLAWQRDSGPLDASGHTPRPAYDQLAIAASGNIAAFAQDATGSFVTLLDPLGRELWRHDSGVTRAGPTLAIDDADRITALDWQGWIGDPSYRQPKLVRYDPAGGVAWAVSIYPNNPSLAVNGGGDIVMTDSAPSVLRRYRGADGALLSEVPIAGQGFHVAADATRVAFLVANDYGPCFAVAWYDLAGRQLSNVVFTPACSGISAYALALVPGGDVFVGGSLSTPYDFSTGTTFTPRGRDAFVVDVFR